MAEAFWMIWNPNGHIPRFKHPTEASACKEAERLATENPNETFIVLQSVAEVRAIRTQWTSHDIIPF